MHIWWQNKEFNIPTQLISHVSMPNTIQYCFNISNAINIVYSKNSLNHENLNKTNKI